MLVLYKQDIITITCIVVLDVSIWPPTILSIGFWHFVFPFYKTIIYSRRHDIAEIAHLPLNNKHLLTKVLFFMSLLFNMISNLLIKYISY